MKNHSYISMQQDMPDQGQLQVTVLDSASNRPVEKCYSADLVHRSPG